MNLQFSAHEYAGVIIVSGSVDALTSVDLSNFINKYLTEGHNCLVVDLSQVEFMSSAGLRALLGGLKECRQQGGDLRLAGAQPGIEKVLRISGFLDIIKAFSDVQEALESFNP